MLHTCRRLPLSYALLCKPLQNFLPFMTQPAHALFFPKKLMILPPPEAFFFAPALP
jgi:hypothetical protein